MARAVLYLASASPRRLTLLRGLGLSPRVVPAHLAETSRSGEPPERMVLRLARAKALAVSEQLCNRHACAVVLAADTTVALDGQALGKPRDEADAATMLRRLSGRSHEVWTGVALVRLDQEKESGGVERTRVVFRPYGEPTIREYVATGEPLDKAGAYGIQGAGARLASKVEGSWSNVVGLPLERLDEWFAEVGIDLADLATRS